jgi:hypothetical protein
MAASLVALPDTGCVAQQPSMVAMMVAIGSWGEQVRYGPASGRCGRRKVDDDE